MSLKEELAAHCSSIVIEYLDEHALERSAMALDAADLVSVNAERPVCLKDKDEVLFMMYHLYSKGHSYYYTLGLCDAMHYEQSDTAKMYRQLASEYFLDSYAITRDRTQFTCPLVKKSNVTVAHPLSKIQLSIRLFFDKQTNSVAAVNSILRNVIALKKKYKGSRADLSGFSASNALHINIGYIPIKMPRTSVFNALCEIEANLSVLKGVLESENVANHCYTYLERIYTLPVIYRSFLYTMFEKCSFNCAFMDFGPFGDTVFGKLLRFPSDDYQRLKFYVKCIKMRQMFHENEDKVLDLLLNALAFKLGLSASKLSEEDVQKIRITCQKNTVAAKLIRKFCNAYEI